MTSNQFGIEWAFDEVLIKYYHRTCEVPKYFRSNLCRNGVTTKEHPGYAHDSGKERDDLNLHILIAAPKARDESTYTRISYSRRQTNSGEMGLSQPWPFWHRGKV